MVKVPLSKEECLRCVKNIIAEVLEIESDDILEDSDIFTDLGADSLAAVAIFVELKRQFGISVPESGDSYLSLSTPRFMTDYVFAQDAEASRAIG